MSAEDTVSGRWVEGLFVKALGPSMTRELTAQLALEGLDLSVPVATTYPRARLVRWLEITAGELFPAQTSGDALRQLGSFVVESLHRSGVIRGPLLTMAKVFGPRRVLRQLADSAKGSSSLRISLVENGSKGASLELNDGELAVLYCFVFLFFAAAGPGAWSIDGARRRVVA